MKVTVEQFLNAGFEFVAGDKVLFGGFQDQGWVIRPGYNPAEWNDGCKHDNCNIIIDSLAPRPNLGTQPVGDDCWVEATRGDDCVICRRASDIAWASSRFRVEIESWKPSLKYLEQQMNDKQESAMNISERDIENAFIKQEDAEVESELSEGDSPIKIGKKYLLCGHIHKNEVATINFMGDRVFVYTREDGIECADLLSDVYFAEYLTPEQLAAKEREDFIRTSSADIFEMIEFYDGMRRDGREKSVCDVAAAYIYDAGYRK